MVRRLPAGAEVQPAGGVHFRVWAPKRKRVDVVIDARAVPLSQEAGGYFSALVAEAGDGTLYRYRLDGGDSFPDPASRFQPEGPHGASQVVDPSKFRWSDGAWRGVEPADAVMYEMHVGTFTREGTWEAAARELPRLAGDGITVIELMPVADFHGRFGWGYDGVDLYAPSRLYGTPDDLRRFVDRAHACGIAVILDVVYNHLGPDGAYHHEFSGRYFTRRYDNEWGEALNFDGEGSAGVREFFIANAGYWIDEFHLDGLRLDATQQIYDASKVNVMCEVTQRVRDAARARTTLVVAENEPQRAQLLRLPEQGGFGMDALWNDDFHHTAVVALTGRREAYYTDYHGSPQEFISAAKRGYLYQGQRYSWQKNPRGQPALDVEPRRFVHFLENHDQVANTARGTRLRLLSSPAKYRALTALLLLGPAIPMLFQGQEFGSTRLFTFFADHKPELAAAVRRGRAEFMKQFRSVAATDMDATLPDPCDPATFERCKLDFRERETNAPIYELHRDLLRLRRETAALRAPLDGAVLPGEAFVLRYFPRDDAGLLLVVNLGAECRLIHLPEPLLAPPEGTRWHTLWSSENPRYGGAGTPELDTEDGWRLPAHSAVLLHPSKNERA